MLETSELAQSEASAYYGTGKRVRGETEDSSLHLYAPENAVKRPTVSILLERGAPSISVEIEGRVRRLIIDTGSNV